VLWPRGVVVPCSVVLGASIWMLGGLACIPRVRGRYTAGLPVHLVVGFPALGFNGHAGFGIIVSLAVLGLALRGCLLPSCLESCGVVVHGGFVSLGDSWPREF